MPSTGSTGATGVSWTRKNSKWMAAVRHGGEQYYLGYFAEEQDAIDAVRSAREAAVQNRLSKLRAARASGGPFEWHRPTAGSGPAKPARKRSHGGQGQPTPARRTRPRHGENRTAGRTAAGCRAQGEMRLWNVRILIFR